MAITSLPISGANGAIRIQNIYAVLGLRGSATLGRDLAWACGNAHGKTNKWARYKPEAIGGVAPITDAERAKNNYGLAPSNPEALNGLSFTPASIQAIAALTWGYKAPVPGTNWARLTDWLGYNHAAVPPMVPPGDVTVLFGKTTASFALINNALRDGSNLLTSDFRYGGTSAADLYLTVVIYRVHKTTGAYDYLIIQSAHAKIGEAGGTTIDVNIAPLRNLANAASYSELQYIMCLTDTQVAAGQNTARPQLYPLVSEVPPIARLIIDRDSPFRVVVTHVSARGRLSEGSTYTRPHALDISRFYGPVAIGSAADYFGVAEGMWLFATVTNTTDLPMALNALALRLVTTHNLATADNNTTEVEAGFGGSGMLRDDGTTLTAVDSITIAAGATVAMVFDATALAMTRPGSGVVLIPARDHTTINASFRHITDQSSFNAVAGTLNIRVHSGSGTQSYTS